MPCAYAFRFSGMVKSTGGSFLNGGKGPSSFGRRLLLPGGEFSFQRDGGVFHQQLHRRAVREALAQEGFVGGVSSRRRTR